MNLSQLYSEICKVPLLSKVEEQVLLDTYFNTEYSDETRARAKNDLLASHRRFAFKKARTLSNGDMEQFEELYNAGCEGLVVGLDKFDNTSGMRFLTYAGWWVYQRQMKSMSEFRLVSLPTQKQQLAVRIRKFREELGRDVSIEELVAEFPDVREKYLREFSQTSYLTYSFDNVNEDDIPVVSGMNAIESSILEDQMYEVIESFGKRDSDIICRMYGLTDEGRSESYSSIQEVYPGVTRQYLKDLKERSLEVLKAQLAGDE